MASIKGISLKGVVMGKGHDGGGFYANLYLNNKKIGTVLDDGWGGTLEIQILKNIEEFNNAAKQYREEHPQKMDVFTMQEQLIEDLLELTNAEKDFKKAKKKGYAALVHLDYRPVDDKGKYVYDAPVPYPSEETFMVPDLKDAQNLIVEKTPSLYKVYKDESDFIIK